MLGKINEVKLLICMLSPSSDLVPLIPNVERKYNNVSFGYCLIQIWYFLCNLSSLINLFMSVFHIFEMEA